jgi:hypothetical protein
MKTLPLLLSLGFMALAGCATFRSGPIMPAVTSIEVNESARVAHKVIDDPGQVAAFRQTVDRLPGAWTQTVVANTAIEASADLKAGGAAVGRVYFGQYWVGLQIPAATAASDATGVVMRVKYVAKPDWLAILLQLGM